MKRIFLSASLALLVLAPAAHAQAQRGPLVVPERDSTEVMLLRLSASSRCQQACVVRAAPYSGERVYESVQVLGDGNRIVQHRSERLYRDADGRTRVESEWLGTELVQIQDPVRNMSYRLYPAQKTGIGMAIGLPAPASDAAHTTLLANGNGAPAGAVKVAEQLASTMARATANADGQRTVRSLGTRQMDGVTVEGTLQSTTVPAGMAGNTLPIVSTVETWHSNALQLDLYSKSTDPRYGERIMRVQNLHRDAPPAPMFSVPADYTIREIARR
jgi:hypothetical protein